VLRLLTRALAVLAAAVLLGGCGAGARRSFQLGIVADADGGTRAGNIAALGARIARVEFSIDATPDEMAPLITRYARHGVRVLLLAGFEGRVPTTAEARNLASWARAFGPSGRFWRHRGGPELAVRDIEFGNETNQAFQFGGCGAGCPSFVARAHAYALTLKAAQEAIDGPLGNSRVGVLAIGDSAGTSSPDWVNGMFDAVPDLADRIAGWTAHPYGPRSGWQPMLDQLVSQTGARGAPATVPIFITEIGIATDNGSCLDSNLGWNPCMTYAQAASSLKLTLAAIQARYGKRIRAIFIYQALDQHLPRSDNEHEHYFGVLTANGGTKGAYTAAVRAMLRSLH
jgi:hypothetical protein